MAHAEDIVLVKNIHLDSDCLDEEDGYSHRDRYQVRWNKMPFSVDAGSVKRFPRYLADHFAKHLIDHILQKQEDEGKGMMLTRDERKRNALKEQIFADVEQTFEADVRSSAQVEAQKIDALNEDFLRKAQSALPSIPTESEEPEETEADEVDMPPPPENYSTWTRPDLFREAKERGLKVKFTAKNAEIIQALKEAA